MEELIGLQGREDGISEVQGARSMGEECMKGSTV